MNALPALRAALASGAVALLLAACGGGGGGDNATPSAPPSAFGASSSFEGICTLEGQKSFIRSYLDENYLWYREIPTVDPAAFTNPSDYFRALLVRTPDANGLPKDRFSAVLPSSQVQTGLVRSAVAMGDPTALLSANLAAVPQTKVVTSSGGRRVGYIQFVDHAEGAQDSLIAAFRQLQAGNVQDLVLDMRANSGGFLYIAQTAASLIAGPSAQGRTFERLQYNDKRNSETAAGTFTFLSQVQFAETDFPTGTPLPQLPIGRVYVLTSGATCSSSESIINSLRGIDFPVILVGQTTCGKPYGFRRKDNCGLAYFPIEFQGFNAKGFGDYTTGFQPTCTVADNPTATPGGNRDPLLGAALFHADSGQCPPAAGATSLGSGAIDAPPATPSRPSWAGRLLRSTP